MVFVPKKSADHGFHEHNMAIPLLLYE